MNRYRKSSNMEKLDALVLSTLGMRDGWRAGELKEAILTSVNSIFGFVGGWDEIRIKIDRVVDRSLQRLKGSGRVTLVKGAGNGPGGTWKRTGK